ncbi:alpha/beta fold hydrolase [Flavihumibacter fluvii]|uniref:alpha/beta fold hydrolase n=1 Tax=Flavihumibacter fluvii TaxID=2838157 RepID=UPI001BDF3368|nr:alpha/beta hydrolase [Flavihumibacter fluvii]ULQ50875.1 alpha/beta hydrolase [Flavihumibacter fluvii]
MKLFKKAIAVLLALLLIAIVVFAILFRWINTEKLPLDETARKMAPGSFVTLTDGITHYEMAGPDTGKVVVLVHGFSVPYYIWDSTFIYLVHKGYRVLRYDEFGRGFSDRPDKVYTAEFLRKQLRELLDSLNIKEVQALVGLSFGGPVTSDFVANYPDLVHQLILVDPLYPQAGPAKFDQTAWLMEFMMAMNPEKMIAGQLTDLKYPERFPTWGDQYTVQMAYKGFRHALVSTRYHYATPDAIRANYAIVHSLHKPVLLIWGRDDQTLPISSADSLQKVLQVDYFPVDDAGHLPHMEKAQVVNEKISAFLQR